MTWEEYAKIILGNKKVAELKKEYNLCTKKYTYGRYKNFINRLKKECKLKEQGSASDEQGSDSNENNDL